MLDVRRIPKCSYGDPPNLSEKEANLRLRASMFFLGHCCRSIGAPYEPRSLSVGWLNMVCRLIQKEGLELPAKLRRRPEHVQCTCVESRISL